MKYCLLISICVAMLMTGCTFGSGAKIETRDDISWASSEQKREEFTYTMYWFLPQPRRSSSSIKDILASLGIGQDGRELEYSPNKEFKLKLEDLAVYQLTVKLQQNNECGNGYKIVDTLWYTKSIILSGYCL